MSIINLIIRTILGRNIRNRKFDGVFCMPKEKTNQIELQVFKCRTAPNIYISKEIDSALMNFVSKGYQLKIVLDGELKERDLSDIFGFSKCIIDKYEKYLIKLKEFLPSQERSYRDCYLVVHKENKNKILNEFMAISYPLIAVTNDDFYKYMEKREMASERDRLNFLKYTINQYEED